MGLKQHIQLFVPPIYYKIKSRLCQKVMPKVEPLPKIVHKGNRMVVIGNGPSLTATMERYTEQIQAADSIMVNYSAMTDMFDAIKPSVYVLIDPAWYRPKETQKSDMEACVETIAVKTNWPMTIVLPSYFKTWWGLERLKKNSNISVIFDGGTWRPMPHKELFRALDENRISPPSYTVLTYCIYLALYWGYEETYLVGADTTFTRDMYVGQKDNVLYTVDSHFYSNEEMYHDPTDPEFKGRRYNSTMEKKLYELYQMFYEYRMLNDYAQWKGLKLYNASEYSMIDCLERKKLS